MPCSAAEVSWIEPAGVAPSVKTTVPVGAGPDAATTVATHATAEPRGAGFGVAVAVSDVATGAVMLTAVVALAALKAVVPAKVTV